MKLYTLSFDDWSSSSGRFFVLERLYTLRGEWTPVCRVRKRYQSWLGFWSKAGEA